MAKTIMHIDLDAFFAAVEEREHPEYRGRPLVVGADPKEGRGRGVVSTANYAARKFGIHSAMPISMAYRACPDAVFVTPSFPSYIASSKNVMAILRKFSGRLEQVGIDEAYVDVTTAVGDYGSSEELAAAIKKEIMEKENLSCSIGVGSNKLVAKVASDFRKPGGLTIVEAGNEKGFLAPLPVRKLLYVGPKTEENLKKLGISTVGHLAAEDEEKLKQLFGKFGSYLHAAASGIADDNVVEDYGPAKSINRNITFEEDTGDRNLVEGAVTEMCSDIQNAMRSHGYIGRTVGIRVRFEDFETLTRAKTLDDYTNDASVIGSVAKKLLQQFYTDRRKFRQVGVRVSNFGSSDKSQKKVSEFA